ncbi:MAG: purine-binding chemotaxis protein CheW [Methylococcaceae bacterium]|nr:MAG: purine-binding chemotaxis protein CheW [Methylococcaceae bacterium]
MNKSPIDWREVELYMEAALAAIENGWTPTPEQTWQILKQRAKALAQEPEPSAAAGEHVECLTFHLAHEAYAVEARFVREVCPLEHLTPLPCTPPFVLGIVNLRGEILSVLDLKKFFGLPEKGLTDLNKVIVLQSGGMHFGVLADAICGVHRLARRDLQPPLPTLTGIHEDYLLGVTAQRLIFLDAAKLLANERLIVHEQVE